MDTQTSSGLPRFQVLCLSGVPWFMKLFISTRTQYIHMSYAALILVYTAEEEFYFCFVFSIHKWLFVWALWRTTSWHSSLVNPTMIAGDLHSNPVFLIYLWDNAVFACVHTWGLDWEMGKWCRRWLIHSWVVSTFWPPSFSGVVDRWSTDALMVTGGCACTHTKTAKKASSVCVCVGGFFVLFVVLPFLLLQGLFHRDRSGHSVAAADCLWVGLARQELCG